MVYSVPGFYPTFDIMRIKTIPFPALNAESCMEFSTEHDKIAVNELGKCFDFDTDICTMSGSDAVCQGDNIKWQRRPITCAQSLSISRSVFLPSNCYKTMRIVTCKGQAYLRQLGNFFIYSPCRSFIIYDL